MPIPVSAGCSNEADTNHSFDRWKAAEGDEGAEPDTFQVAAVDDVSGDKDIGPSQYMSSDYHAQLAGHGIRQSVGRTGMCWDNSVAESVWSSLKRELVHRYRFATEPRHGRRSSSGSTGTTGQDATPRSATWPRTNGNSATVKTANSAALKPHSPVSGRRGEAHGSTGRDPVGPPRNATADQAVMEQSSGMPLNSALTRSECQRLITG